YIFQWMTGRRSGFRIVPAALLIVAFVLFMIFSFVAGLPYAQITPAVLRKFAEMTLSILLTIVLVDVIRDTRTVRRLALAIILVGALQGAIGLILVRINPDTANQALNSLGRFGYPMGIVVRWVNDDPMQAERAIGTWVDPNSFGFLLMMAGVVTGTQILSDRPVTGKRWIAFLMMIPILGALYFSRSRQAQVALVAALVFLALLRYRWLIPVLILSAVVILVLPATRDDVTRFFEGVNGQDLSTQMRFGEYKDALVLIQRYPLIGVGFAGAPDRDIYLAVADVYLTIAGNVGLVGLAIYLLAIIEVFRYSFARWKALRAQGDLFVLWLGFMAALAGALVQGVFDHFYFHMEFQAAVALYWMFIALTLACAKIAELQAADESAQTAVLNHQISVDRHETQR
ncbi:MAG TPA: O-antigen ligase family protein, partial [Aggregatilineales bacterium]|nr:O-antigen ligase family protein [Aggregatilineales bacterium]